MKGKKMFWTLYLAQLEKANKGRKKKIQSLRKKIENSDLFSDDMKEKFKEIDKEIDKEFEEIELDQESYIEKNKGKKIIGYDPETFMPMYEGVDKWTKNDSI